MKIAVHVEQCALPVVAEFMACHQAGDQTCVLRSFLRLVACMATPVPETTPPVVPPVTTTMIFPETGRRSVYWNESPESGDNQYQAWTVAQRSADTRLLLQSVRLLR